MASKQLEAIIADIIPKLVPLPKYTFDAVIHIGDINIDVLRVAALTVRESPLTHMFAVRLLSVVVLPSDYHYKILAGHQDISITLIKMDPNGKAKEAMKYNAVLIKTANSAMEGNTPNSDNVVVLDETNIVTITFQLIAPIDYNLRTYKVGNTYLNTTAVDALVHILNQIKLSDKYNKKESVAKFVIDENAQDKVFRSIQIPDGTSLMALPDYLQNNYGIFNQGMCCFLKSNIWFIFAPYGLGRTTNKGVKLVVINAPPYRHRAYPATFTIDGNIITVLATGTTRHGNKADTDALNVGTAIAHGSASSLLGMQLEPNGSPSIDPYDHMTVYRSSRYANAKENVIYPKEKFTDNPAKYASQLAALGGDYVDIVWENGVIDVLAPGMPVLYITGEGDKIIKRKGVLINAEAHYNVENPGLVKAEMISTVKLALFLKDTGNVVRK